MSQRTRTVRSSYGILKHVFLLDVVFFRDIFQLILNHSPRRLINFGDARGVYFEILLFGSHCNRWVEFKRLSSVMKVENWATGNVRIRVLPRCFTCLIQGCVEWVTFHIVLLVDRFKPTVIIWFLSHNENILDLLSRFEIIFRQR